MLNVSKILKHSPEEAEEYKLRFDTAMKELVDFMAGYLEKCKSDESLCSKEKFDELALKALQESFEKNLNVKEIMSLCYDSYVGHLRSGLYTLVMQQVLTGVFDQIMTGKGGQPCTCPKCTGNREANQQPHQE